MPLTLASSPTSTVLTAAASVPPIVDDLITASATSSLSANQGVVLNAADITSGSVSGNTLTLTLKGGGTVNIDVTALAADIHCVSASYNTGTQSIDFICSPTSANFSVPVSALVPVTTDMSITGNGGATALTLVGDAASPGNLMAYATNGAGVKGWYGYLPALINLAFTDTATPALTSVGAVPMRVDTAAASALNLGTLNAATINIGNAAASVNLGIGATTGTVIIGGSAQTGQIQIGTGTSTGPITIGGTGNRNTTLNGGSAGNVNIGQNTITGSINLGGGAMTGTVMIRAGNVNFGGTTTAIQLNGAVGTAGQVLTSAGAGATPTWSTPAAGVSPATVISPASSDATGAVGTSTLYARQDHTHPADPVSANAGNGITIGTDGLHYMAAPVATTVVDNVTTSSSTSALSANQGVVLNAADIASGAVSGNNLTLTLKGGGTVVVDVTALVADIKLQSGVYNAGTGAIDFTLTDASVISVPVSALLPVNTTNSITGDGAGTALKLSGDVAAPGNTMGYGTDGAGVKGWYARMPALTNITLIDTSTPSITSTGALPFAIDTGGAATLTIGNTNATTVTVGKGTGTTTNVRGATVNIGGIADSIVNVGQATTTGTINIGTNLTTGTVNFGDGVNWAGGLNINGSPGFAGVNFTGTFTPLLMAGSAGTVGQVLSSSGPNFTPAWTNVPLPVYTNLVINDTVTPSIASVGTGIPLAINGGSTTSNLTIGGTTTQNVLLTSTNGTVTVGPSFASSNTFIQAGAGGTVSVGNQNALTTLNLGSLMQTGSIVVGNALTTGAITIGSTTGTGNITIGNSTGAQAVNIGIGNANTITLGSNGGAQTGNILIGNGTSTGQIQIGNSTGTGTIQIGGTGARTINIGGGAGGAVNVGNTLTTGAINIGNSQTSGTVNIGTGTTRTSAINIGGAGSGASVAVNAPGGLTITTASGGITATGNNISLTGNITLAGGANSTHIYGNALSGSAAIIQVGPNMNSAGTLSLGGGISGSTGPTLTTIGGISGSIHIGNFDGASANSAAGNRGGYIHIGTTLNNALPTATTANATAPGAVLIAASGNATTGAFPIVMSGSNIQRLAATGNWGAPSDRRLKENFEPIANALEKVSGLFTGTYNMKATPGARVAGFIAQEVAEVLPEAVDVPADPDEMLFLKALDMLPLAVAAIKELRMMMINMQHEIDALKKR